MTAPLEDLPEFGSGPIEEIYQSFVAGRIGEKVALARVTDRSFVETLTPAYLDDVSHNVVGLGYSGEWQTAARMHRLIWACFHVSRDRFGALGPRLAARHLMVHTNALWHQPNPALYEEALRIGTEEYEACSDRDERGALAKQLGILHLDPYAAARSGAEDVKRWWLGATSDDARERMPDASAAMDLAELWLRKALPDTREIVRLETLKALLQCLFAREMFGGTVDEGGALPFHREAVELSHLAPDRADISSFLQSVGRRLGAATPSDPLPQLLAEDWEDFARERGIGHVSIRVVPALQAALRGDPSAGLALADRVLPVYDSAEDEQQRVPFYDLVLRLLSVAQSTASPKATKSRWKNPLRRARAGTEWDAERVQQGIARIFELAGRSLEDDAYAALEELIDRAPSFASRYESPLRYLAAQLRLGAGVNAFRAGDRVDDAIHSYYDAWLLFCKVGCVRLAVEMLERLADVVRSASSRSIQSLCELIREQSFDLGQLREEEWNDAIARVAAGSVIALRDGGTSGAWFAVFRLAKGPAFANSMLLGERYDWTADARARELFAQFEAAERSSGWLASENATRLFEETLVSRSTSLLDTSGTTAAQERDGLAFAFDHHVQRRVARAAKRATARFTLEEARRALPADGVLVDVYVPRHGSRNSVYCLIATVEEERFFAVDDFAKEIVAIRMEGDVAGAEFGPLAYVVASLRRDLQADPEGNAHGAPGVEESLHTLCRACLGHGIEYLDELWDRGKRHLIVVPSGPLHFAPLHLMSPRPGSPLAERWIVTQLPTLDLCRRASADGPDRDGAAAFALGYRSPWAKRLGLTRLDNTVAEAQSVARSLGVEPVLDDRATRERVRTALTSAEHVHIACHGELNVLAPSLQALYLTPEGDDDGRLFSVDLMALDLSGLSLLALSACETALGRVDNGDNLRGLSAAALTAGASCVVGSLWPAADDSTRTFFTELFAGLARGDSRRDAFFGAQRAARDAFPAYRDWGAYYLTGMW